MYINSSQREAFALILPYANTQAMNKFLEEGTTNIKYFIEDQALEAVLSEPLTIF
jgi:hypothetical protein